VRHVLLALLADGPVHGYDLKRTYDGLFASVWGPVNIGQIYVTMGRHERDGLVTRHRDERHPDRKLYELTDLGHKHLAEWLRAPADPPAAKSEVLLRLVSASLLGAGTSREVVADHRQRCLEQLRALDRLSGTATPGTVAELALQNTALHLQAELRWLDLCDQRLRDAPVRLPGADDAL